jgi:hypothetical protein
MVLPVPAQILHLHGGGAHRKSALWTRAGDSALPALYSPRVTGLVHRMQVWCWLLIEIHTRVRRGIVAGLQTTQSAAIRCSGQWWGCSRQVAPAATSRRRQKEMRGSKGGMGGWTDKGGWPRPLASLPHPPAGATAACTKPMHQNPSVHTAKHTCPQSSNTSSRNHHHQHQQQQPAPPPRCTHRGV